jgi:hypothetical protein
MGDGLTPASEKKASCKGNPREYRVPTRSPHELGSARRRLKMNNDVSEALVQRHRVSISASNPDLGEAVRFVGYARELSGPNVKPVPPFLFEISKDSRDHS